VVGEDMPIVAGAGMEKIAEFFVAATGPSRQGEALEAPHRSDPAFHAAMV
jgi:hypothetical protein